MTDEQNFQSESEYIIIPNPIYDVVFRYLMEDPESATIVLSTLINEKIIRLELEPQTHTEKRDNPIHLTNPTTGDDLYMFHLDFTATIELPDGSEEMIMIELQKASQPDDIFRFKRYISSNFLRKQVKEIIHPTTLEVTSINKPIRLIPIFILNFRIENEINDLLIRTNRIKTGVFKNKPLKKTNEFIDNLSYDILVVQLPNIQNITEIEYDGDEYKRKLFALLKLFDQKSKVKDNEHRLRLISWFFPGFLGRVIKRLQAADINNPVLEKQMFAEDEYLKALTRRDNQITWMQEGIEKRDKTIEEKDKTIEEKDKTIEEKDKTIEEKGKALEEKDIALNETRRIIFDLAKTLKDSGFTNDAVIQKTGLSNKEIENL